MLTAMVLTAAYGMAKDIKLLFVTTTPEMHCTGCEERIKGNLRFEKGVKKIETDIPNQTVTIEYDADKTSPEQLIQAFTKFGYEAKEIKKVEEEDKDKQ